MSASTPILNEIRKQISRVRSLENKQSLQLGFFLFATTLLSGGAFLSLLELLFRFGADVRTIIVVSFSVGIVVLLGWFVLRPLLRILNLLPSADDFVIAGKIGDSFPHIRDRLLNLLQLHKEVSEGTSLYSAELVDASFQDLSGVVQSTDFTRAIDSTPVRRSLRQFLITTGCVIFIVVLFPASFSDAAYRLVYVRTEFTAPPNYVFDISPGNKEVVKGADVEISIGISSPGQLDHRQLPLHFSMQRENQTRADEVVLRADSAGFYRTTLEGLRTTTTYFARLADTESDRFKLTVIDRPVIRSLQVRLDYPPYAKLQPRLQEEFVGDVTALAGTRVTISGLSSKPLRHAQVLSGNASAQLVNLPMNVRGERFSLSFALTREASYKIEVTDHEDLKNLDPITYQLKIIPDESPTAAILFPGRNIDIAGDKSLPLLIQIKDDFGFTKLRLGYRLAHSRYEEASPEHTFLSIPLPSEITTQGEVRYAWNLSPLKLVPEDIVEYFAEVFDNDAVNGPKSGRSDFYLLRLPSLEEVFTDLNKGHDEAIDQIQKALEEAKDLKEKLDAINQDLKKNKEFDWQQQKKAQEMVEKYQQVQKNLEKLQSKVDEMVQQMQQHNVLSPETLEKYLELQQLMSDLNSSELQQLLKQMQQAMQNVNKEQMQQALQQMTFSEERFRQSIERTMNLLKRIQIEQKLDEAKKRAEEMAKLQEEIQEQMQQAENDPGKQAELARREEDLARQQQHLEEHLSDLQQRMEEFFTEMPSDKLEKLNEEMRAQNLQDKMRQAAQLTKQRQFQTSRQMQQNIQQQLQQSAQQLDALQQEMLQQQSQYVMNELRKAINNLLELSKREEQLKQQSQNAPGNSPQLRQNAQDQMGVMQDLRNVVQDLGELGQRSFAVTPEMGRSIGEAMARMQNAMRSLDVRNGQMASAEQNAAMAALNRAATQVQQSLQSMMQAQAGGQGAGLMQQLQMMAGQQMSINMQTQQMGQGMSQQQAANAARLAMEQEALRKSLEQLNKEAQTSGDRERVLGDLERIAQEMREVVTNLEQQNINPETLQKQERILSRLLDASRSMRERDFEKRRRAQTGSPVARRSPSDIDPSALQGRSRLYEDLLKAIEQGYSKDYQELIQKYFEELQKIEAKRQRN
jgi:hypothetical protein